MEMGGFWLEKYIAEGGGAITFAQFMALALYHPEHGYYAAQIDDVGRAGDFSTSATLCPAFGEAIASWALARSHEDFPMNDFALIELGAGNGQLAESFLTAWRKNNGPAVPYIAIDVSTRLRPMLAARAEQVGFLIQDNLPAALAAANGRALIFSNELVDAFPARQLCWDDNDWREVGLCLEGGALVEEILPFTDAVDAEAPAEPRSGQCIFIHPSYHEWLRSELAHWHHGRMLTIDYGAARPAAECRAYLGQERREGSEVYKQAGQQDITCDVNFADLQRWGEQLGWQTIFRETQGDFLENWLSDAASRAKIDAVLGFLMNPFAAGGAFLALEQRR
ncbi:SAM-dependent methyltransferase [Cerasicoccus arenae]|uniref:SAM-dependent methyltransferase n=1 Tax=Cerasicoccus arenae TaxID=424488 RepID=A0A8J3DB55_9BACT|nr:SAM-dependent methyltransferase [Cerasicoccus arenae]MBK1857941.1 SAM-dependent methyltransferase [Cerasicoccus arenae]GHB97928.1 SAM-dependent methyltransferase [Cerasicoccus arenae]